MEVPGQELVDAAVRMAGGDCFEARRNSGPRATQAQGHGKHLPLRPYPRITLLLLLHMTLDPAYLSLRYLSASAISACHSCNSRSDVALLGPILSDAVPYNDAAVLYSAVRRGHFAIVDSQKDRTSMS